MRIRAIRGAGLASLAEPFAVELDAEPIRSCGVFVIGGPTGAGKSTILDALCLALFDRAPRIERAPRAAAERAPLPDAELDAESREAELVRASDPRSLVRRGATQAHAEVDFDARGGGSFRARWEVRAARRRDGTRALAKQSLSLIELRTSLESGKVELGARVGTTKTDVLREIESRLGLDYSQFCRSVLLPQGELASFLEAPDDERARLLERITGTEVYSQLSRTVHERAASLLREVRERTIELDALPLLGEPEASELEARRQEAILLAARASKRLAELASSLRLHETTRVLGDELVQAERELDELRRQLVLWETRRAEVDLARRARDVRAEREALAATELDLVTVERELARLDAELAELAAQGEAHEACQLAASAELASFVAESAGVEAAIEAHERALSELAEGAGPHEELKARRRHAEAAEKEADRRAREAQKAADAFAREVEADVRALETLRSLDGPGGASTEPLAALLRGELRPGEPCPVCGSGDHPLTVSAPHSGQRGRVEVAETARAIEERQRLVARIEQLRVGHARAASTLAARREDHERCQLERQAAEAAADAGAAARERERAEVVAAHGSEAPAARRTAHARTHERLRGVLSSVERELRSRELSVERSRARCELLRARVAELAQVAIERGEALDRRLAEQALTRADLSRIGGLAEREVDGWAGELARLDQHRDRHAAIVDERRRRLEQQLALQPAELAPREMLEAAMREAETDRSSAEQVRAGAEARLADDEARRADQRERAAALEALRTEAGTWETLSRLVGSADGKKLRVLVQSIALDVLLSHANHHLRVLAPRYQLARRGGASLALDVVDGELEGAPRATSSLSGGERFLVSLALALGLGTMTAERDDVGSLFLDEGFGSLDEESLEQALEVLDALRQAGRQIGVVSHVGRLAERFSVRVEVLPVQPGESIVRVRAV